LATFFTGFSKNCSVVKKYFDLDVSTFFNYAYLCNVPV